MLKVLSLKEPCEFWISSEPCLKCLENGQNSGSINLCTVLQFYAKVLSTNSSLGYKIQAKIELDVSVVLT